jgi:multidrug efflux system membrane fusion protein
MRRFLIVLVIAVLAGAGGWWWFTQRATPAATQAARAGQRTNLPIPVVVAAAEKQDVPIYLDGLGTALASATVTIKPMVDGPLIDVLFREGQDVRVGDVLARIDPRTYQAQYDAALAKKRQDEANLANARLDAARYAKLAASNYSSAQQSDTARSQVAQLEAQVASDQAQIDNMKTLLSYTTVVAPIEGRVGIRQVDPGNIVHASDPAGLVVITTLKPISVVFTLPQQNLRDVAAAMNAGTVEVLALPQDSTAAPLREVLDRGTLTVVDNQVDTTTGTIKLKATFPNDAMRLWPGAFVTVRLRARIASNATVVPPVSVQRGPKGPYVFVVNDDLSVTRRNVTVGHEDLRATVIAEGVVPGERVVVDGASRLTDGAKIQIVPPAGQGAAPAGPPTAATPGAATPGANGGRQRRSG